MKIETRPKKGLVTVHPIAEDGLQFEISRSIKDLESRWENLIPKDLFFTPSFLSALETSPPSGTFYRYVIYSNHGQDIGFAYFQIKLIQLDKSLKIVKGDETGLDKIFAGVKHSIAKRLRSHVVVCGNVTLTGNFGFRFNNDFDRDKQFQLIEEASSVIEAQLDQEDKHAAAVMLKDFYQEETKPKNEDFVFTKFSVQPNMIMNLDPDWHSFDDYLSAMKSKYRVRVRRALKKFKPTTKRILSLAEIESYQEDIFRLYKYVAEQANFNLFILPANYFYTLSKALGSHMRITGYFMEDKMVGFFTSIHNNEGLDAHFLGYDPEYNVECQLYLNMLYDLLREGIEKRCKHVDMSRTAMEIKSSVGAEPIDMFIYLKLTSKWKNRFVPVLLDYMKPADDWVPRSPFKT